LTADPAHGRVPLVRGLLWGLLVAALVGVGMVAAWSRFHRPEPPPVLGRVPAFSLTNRDGRTVTAADLAGAPWIADFIFTRCAASCPMMTARMTRLDRALPAAPPIHLVSFTVDPAHDTPEVLARYAARQGAPPRWLFLTGPADRLLDLSRRGFKLAVGPAPAAGAAPADDALVHSTRFVLVDGGGGIRGYYDGFDEEAMARLEKDLEALQLTSR